MKGIDKVSLAALASKALKLLTDYAVVWFFVLLIGVYGFAAFKIYTSQTAEPTDVAVNAEVRATTTPHVDQKVISEMQSLQDHSVNVKTLFDQARSNPFQE